MEILLLEDDTILAQSLKDYLELEGFKVDLASNAQEVYDLTFVNSYDLYIFDINLEQDSGFDILKELKSSGDTTPTIYISALSDINSISKGFSLGAQDYIKKPFEPEELVIRIKSRLFDNKNIIKYKNLEYNLLTKEIVQDGKIISLGEIQGNIFHKLMQNIGKVVPQDELIEFQDNKNANALRVNLAKIKNKLNIDIKNIRGLGYMIPKIEDWIEILWKNSTC